MRVAEASMRAVRETLGFQVDMRKPGFLPMDILVDTDTGDSWKQGYYYCGM